MKKIILVVFLAIFMASSVDAFLYQMKFLKKEEIKALNDEELTNVYIEARIEDKASKEFHVAAGFNSSKEYNKRKDLIRFIINLRREMSERDVDSNFIEEWIQ